MPNFRGGERTLEKKSIYILEQDDFARFPLFFIRICFASRDVASTFGISSFFKAQFPNTFSRRDTQGPYGRTFFTARPRLRSLFLPLQQQQLKLKLKFQVPDNGVYLSIFGGTESTKLSKRDLVYLKDDELSVSSATAAVLSVLGTQTAAAAATRCVSSLQRRFLAAAAECPTPRAAQRCVLVESDDFYQTAT